MDRSQGSLFELDAQVLRGVHDARDYTRFGEASPARARDLGLPKSCPGGGGTRLLPSKSKAF
jgi:hypothetical protein